MDRNDCEEPVYSKTALRRDQLSHARKPRIQTQVPEDGHPVEIEDILFTIDEDDQ